MGPERRIAHGSPSEWAARLGRCLRQLQIAESTKLLAGIRAALDAAPDSRALLGDDNAKLLVYFGLGADFNPEYLHALQRIVSGFDDADRGSLRLHELACLGVAKGLIAFFRRNYDVALSHLDEAERDVSRTGDRELMVITGYYIARCHWRLHDYERAIQFAAKAREQEEGTDGSKRGALIQLLEGYLELLRGKYDEAMRLLEQAREVLRETDDHISLGNLISFDGQRLRRMGNYQDAIKAFDEANDIFAKHAPSHRNRARCLANRAVALRLLAQEKPLRLSGMTDAEYRELVVENAQDLRAEAWQDLKEARRIYNQLRDERGLAKCSYIGALCHLDEYKLSGTPDELHKAESEALKAHKVGERIHDDLVVARAAITRCEIQLARGTPKLNGVKGWNLAVKAEEASKRSKNRRVQARASIWKGIAVLREPFVDLKEAIACLSTATGLLAQAEQDYLRRDLNALISETEVLERVPKPLFVVDLRTVVEVGLQRTLNDCERVVVEHVYELCCKKLNATTRMLKVGERRVKKTTETGKLRSKTR
jgi:tetratricopeptide (TPR) repeat protein